MAENKSLIATLENQLQEKSAAVEGISSAFKTDDKGRFEISPEQYASYKKAVAEAKEVKSALDAARDADNIKAYLAGDAQLSVAATDMEGAARQLATEGKSLGDMFIESDAYQQALAEGFGQRPHISAQIEGKSLYNFSTPATEVPSLGASQDLGITERALRKNHIRDLFPKSTTKSAVLYGLRETGWTNAAAQIRQMTAADGTSPAVGDATDVWGRSPESDLEFTPVLFPVAEVSHMLNAHKNLLADEPRLRSFINNRLIDGVKYAEDWDLLHSVGDGEKITGLFNTPGVQQYTGQASDGYSVQVRRAITKALLAEYDPSGIVVSPTMWERIEVEQDANGQFRVAVAVAVGAEKRVWRLNVVETTAMQDTKFVLGSWGMGAQLHDREAVSVQVSTEHGQNFREGVVSFKGAERIAFEVSRPESFVIGTWTEPTAP